MSRIMMRPASVDALGAVLRGLAFSRDPVPPSLRVADKVFNVADVAADIANFRQQRFLLDRAKQPWPAVTLQYNSGRFHGRRLVPLNLLSYVAAGRMSGADIALVGNQSSQEASKSGLEVSYLDSDQALNAFAVSLAEFLESRGRDSAARSFAVGSADDGDAFTPPSDLFTVTTDHDREEVLFAKGYFFSTTQGFGFSTPACRTVEHGNYTFGIRRHSGPIFSETVWSVPEVMSIHLSV